MHHLRNDILNALSSHVNYHDMDRDQRSLPFRRIEDKLLHLIHLGLEALAGYTSHTTSSPHTASHASSITSHSSRLFSISVPPPGPRARYTYPSTGSSSWPGTPPSPRPPPGSAPCAPASLPISHPARSRTP